MCYGVAIGISGNSVWVDNSDPGQALSGISDVAQTFLVGEPAAPTADGAYCIYPAPGNLNRIPYSIHFDGANWLYADGHVKWMRTDQAGQTSNALWKKVK